MIKALSKESNNEILLGIPHIVKDLQ